MGGGTAHGAEGGGEDGDEAKQDSSMLRVLCSQRDRCEGCNLQSDDFPTPARLFHISRPLALVHASEKIPSEGRRAGGRAVKSEVGPGSGQVRGGGGSGRQCGLSRASEVCSASQTVLDNACRAVICVSMVTFMFAT